MLHKDKNFWGVSLSAYLATFFIIFIFSFLVYTVVSFYQNGSFNLKNGKTKEEIQTGEKFLKPERIIISKIGIDQPILNPESKLVEDLDKELLKGVVRYPDSGLLGEKKNMLLFGHSTGYKIVQNQAFKAFNKINELKEGDDILLVSGNMAYLYGVVSSNEVSDGKALVEFDNKDTLTLSTCNTFGAKEARFVVKAKFARSYLLAE